MKFDITTPNAIHLHQKLKTIFYLLSPLIGLFLFLAIRSAFPEWDKSFVFLVSFLGPFLAVFLGFVLLPSRSLHLQNGRLTVGDDDLQMIAVTSVVRKRMVFQSVTFRIFNPHGTGWHTFGPLYLVTDVYTFSFASKSKDLVLGTIVLHTQDPDLALRTEILEDHSALFMEVIDNFPAPDVLLIRNADFPVFLASVPPIRAPSGGKPFRRKSPLAGHCG